MTAPGPLLTPVDVAAQLGVHRQTLAAWRHKGQGPRFVKVGRSVRYRPGDLEAWLSAQSRVDTRERAS